MTDSLEKLTQDGEGFFIREDGTKIPYTQCKPVGKIAVITFPLDYKNGIEARIPPDLKDANANAYTLSSKSVGTGGGRELNISYVHAIQLYHISNQPISEGTL